MSDGIPLREEILEAGLTLTSPSVLPALSPNGSKKPRGEVWPARPSADIDTFVNAGRAMTAGRNATAEAASEATMIVWNILVVGGNRIVLQKPKYIDEVVGMMHFEIPRFRQTISSLCRFAGGRLTDMTHAQ